MWQILGAGDNSALYSLTQETNKGPRFIQKLWDPLGCNQMQYATRNIRKKLSGFATILIATLFLDWYYRSMPKSAITWIQKSVSFFGTIISGRYLLFDNKRTFYPPKGRAGQTEWGPLDSLSIIYVIEKPTLNFQKHARGAAFFETLKTFIVRIGW